MILFIEKSPPLPPEVGTQRITSKFAWWPTKVWSRSLGKRVTVWLQTYYIKEQYGMAYGGKIAPGWNFLNRTIGW